LCTRLIVFTSVMAGHAEHTLRHPSTSQISDKVIRYPNRINVTTPALRSYGIYTQHFDLAETYVFIKQSEFSCHCDQ